MLATFTELVRDIWGPSHQYGARLRVKGEVGCDVGGVRPRRHQGMINGHWVGIRTDAAHLIVFLPVSLLVFPGTVAP